MELPFAFAVGLALVHLFAGIIRVDGVIQRRWWLSFAGGVSVAYVFIHLLPELNEGQETLVEASILTSFLDHHAYLVALAGFVVFYGLEQVAQRSHGSDDEASKEIFWLHMGSFTVYNGLIGYLLVHRLSEGLWNVAVFTLAMALHFFVTDAGLRRHHPELYHNLGRWLLAPVVVAGWLLAQVVDVAEPSLAVIIAFLAGGIILNVAKEELPDDRQSAFLAFLVGIVGYTVLLLGV